MEGHSDGAPMSTPHGVKRRAEEDPRDDQRLAKRFDLLNLDRNGKLYVPVPHESTAKQSTTDDLMHIDDSKNKVYIHNLDEELANIDSEENMVFLPDIEKKIGKIPQHILTGDLQPTAQNQMILYGVPSSLSIPKEQDSVRKAILESRDRARKKSLVDAAADAQAQDERNHDYVISADMDDYEDSQLGVNGNYVEDAMDLG